MEINTRENSQKKKEKILLGLLPFWSPIIPPPGIAALKGFLQQYGFEITTVDANIETRFKEIHDRYFDVLRDLIPDNKKGNFVKSVYEVLRNHMTVHINYTDRERYFQLVKLLIYKNFYIDTDDRQVSPLMDLLDMFFHRLEVYFTALLEKEKPDVLGLSATIGTLAASLFAFQLAKKRSPHIKTVMGGGLFAWGLHRSPDFDFFLEKTPYIDKIIIGEGQQLFLKLLQGKLPGAQRVYSLEDINGQTLDISAVGIPDLSDFDTAKYPYLGISGSIGCPFKCSFCNFPALFGDYKKKKGTRIRDEMMTLYKKFKFKSFFMNDLLINPILPDLADVLKDNEIMFYWDTHMRVDESVGDSENTLLWRRAGLYRVRLGVESGSRRVLDLMKKNITVEQARAAISSLAYAGIKTSVFIIVGFPGETEEDFQQTMDFIEELKNDLWQVETSPFMYFYEGQVDSAQWAPQRVSLYPQEFRDMLLTQTWIMDCQPTREETYERLSRLEEHCRKLAVPVAFSSLKDLHKADERWKRLHENAVPSLVQITSNEPIDDGKNLKKLILAQNTQQDNRDFVF